MYWQTTYIHITRRSFKRLELCRHMDDTIRVIPILSALAPLLLKTERETIDDMHWQQNGTLEKVGEISGTILCTTAYRGLLVLIMLEFTF